MSDNEKKIKVKRQKTVECYNKTQDLLSSNEESNQINITINTNSKNKISKRKKRRSKSKQKIKRQKTDYNFSPKKTIEQYINEITPVQNVNININYNEMGRKNSYSQEKKRISSLWTKTKNFQKMLNAFLHPSVVKIDDKDIFCDTLKTTLLDNDNTIKYRPIFKKNTTNNHYNITLSQFLRKSEVEKELFRVNLKAKAFQLITEGISSLNNTQNIIEEFEKLFSQNPEKDRYLPEDKNHLFNQRLSNGKTLLYIACQEGATDIVKYFLQKKLNPNIKAIYFDMEDTCLSVSVRWNYYDIVKLILESNRIYEEDIEDTLENEICNDKIKQLLISYIPDDRKKRKGCTCF
jgi:hypothetical protein